jgi:hypothetical protein
MMRIWRRSALFAEVAADDGQRVALLSLERRRPVVLVDSAAVIWSLVDGTRSEAEILDELQRIYGEDPAIAAQMSAFLVQLEEHGLAEAVE